MIFSELKIIDEMDKIKVVKEEKEMEDFSKLVGNQAIKDLNLSI